MAIFEISIVKIDDIKDHDNADSLELAIVGGFVCVTRIGSFLKGELAVYIPEASILPEAVIKTIGMWDEEKKQGKLSGKQGNRVKIVKLRGVYSQGILYHLSDLPEMLDENGKPVSPVLGSNVMDLLGIKKYVPQIPTHMEGEVCAQFGNTVKFDVENIQKHPGILADGELVTFTEKRHGTFCCWGYVGGLSDKDLYDGCAIVASKSMCDKGMAFKYNEKNQSNLYVKMFNKYMLDDNGKRWNILKQLAKDEFGSIYILGEIFGRGVQDLHYGHKEPIFECFDIYVGTPGSGRFLNAMDKMKIIGMLNIPDVPILFAGQFSMILAEQYRDGASADHMREGIVIRPVVERRDESIGRVMLKYVSPKYLSRRGTVTEFN